MVFSLRDLPDELKAAGTLLVLDSLWRRVSDPAGRRRRLVVVDEAWLLMREPEGARFLFRLAKSARKLWCGVTVVTQDAADLLGSELGQAVVTNAAITRWPRWATRRSLCPPEQSRRLRHPRADEGRAASSLRLLSARQRLR